MQNNYNRILHHEKLKTALSSHSDKKVGFTNGCFDIIHAGHLKYLNEAKSLCNILVVAVNSDESVKRLKGEKRPIVTLGERMAVLAGLRSVDYVTWFNEDTPYNLIKFLKPDILMKGGDWPISKIIGSDIVLEAGGVVESLSYKENVSTTDIIEKIIDLFCK